MMSSGVGRHGQLQTGTCHWKIRRIFQVGGNKPLLIHIFVGNWLFYSMSLSFPSILCFIFCPIPFVTYPATVSVFVIPFSKYSRDIEQSPVIPSQTVWLSLGFNSAIYFVSQPIIFISVKLLSVAFVNVIRILPITIIEIQIK